MADHEVVVLGVWHNDSTAGLEVYCRTCEVELRYEESDDGLTLEEITEVIAEHTKLA